MLTIPAAAAVRPYSPMAPQWLEFDTPTTPMPFFRASAIAAAIARWHAKIPCPCPPSSWAEHGPVRLSRSFGRGSMERACSRVR